MRKHVTSFPITSLDEDLESQNLASDGGPDEQDHDGRITCDVCGKDLYVRQLYRGRLRCFECAMNEHKQVVKHMKYQRRGQFDLPFSWDSDAAPWQEI